MMNWQAAILDALTDELQNQPDVRALIVLGSVAEADRVDQWSDLDIMAVFTEEALPRYYPGANWLRFAGDVLGMERHSDAHSGLIRMALADGRRIDAIVTTEASLGRVEEW